MKSGKQIIEKWVEIFNRGDAAEIAQLYHEDAVNHQVANEPIFGRDAIEQMFKNEFAQAEMTCIVENLFEDKDWVILEWKDPLELRGCGFFQIEDSKINEKIAAVGKLSNGLINYLRNKTGENRVKEVDVEYNSENSIHQSPVTNHYFSH